MEIERYIPEGREHAISRKELQALLGRDDRVIREWIKQANRRLEAECPLPAKIDRKKVKKTE